MSNQHDELLQDKLRSYRRKLKRLGPILEKVGGNGEWGVASLNETLLVWLFAETWRTGEYKLEPTYERTQLRADLQIFDPPIWIEARWWWRPKTIDPILRDLEHKLRQRRSKDPAYALVFTVDEEGVSRERHNWTLNGAPQWMEALTPRAWDWVDAAAVKSRYVGQSSKDKALKPRDGVFVASIYSLRQSRRSSGAASRRTSAQR